MWHLLSSRVRATYPAPPNCSPAPLQCLGSAGVHCNGCLALMALVRGEGDASDANRTLVAELFGVEIIAQGEAAVPECPSGRS